MREPLEMKQLAKLAGISNKDLQSYRARGLIDPDGDGLLDEMDVLRLRLLMHYKSLGHTIEDLDQAIKATAPLVLYADLLWGEPEEMVSVDEAAAELDIPVDAVRTMLRAVGLGATVPRSDLRFLETVKGLVDSGIPLKMMLDVARVYGDSLRRLAQTEVKMIRGFLTESGPTDKGSSLLKDAEQSQRLQSLQDLVMPMLEPLLLTIHRRHLLRASVQEALADLEAAERGTERADLEATIAFVDLASFTSLARVHGDEVAADILDRFDGLVRRLLDEHGGNLIKQIGDAFMLVFAEPANALRFAIHLDAAIAREANFPAVRTGINAGPVLYRVGDYVGNTVNIAARIAAMASAHEILLTESVADAAESVGVKVASTGKHELAGVDEPIELWRVDRKTALQPQRDPVCGMAVSTDAVARLRYEDVEYAFCSPVCLRKFLEDPERYVSVSREGKPEL
jgi:class 3 adenylate cyclase/YHS domain-containing protein/DNA-binding transcriptional MerR regulator